MALEKYEVRNRSTGAVQFVAEIEVTPDMTPGLKLGLAVRWGIKSWADLAGADLSRANLSRADLSGANLSGAYLSGAYLSGAYLSLVENLKLPHFQIPQEGELVVWKALQNGVMCKLRIPPEAKRTASVIGRKCRAEFVEVIEGTGVSKHDSETRYAPGLIVKPDKYDDNPLVECAPGIHFFLTEAEASEWL